MPPPHTMAAASPPIKRARRRRELTLLSMSIADLQQVSAVSQVSVTNYETRNAKIGHAGEPCQTAAITILILHMKCRCSTSYGGERGGILQWHHAQPSSL